MRMWDGFFLSHLDFPGENFSADPYAERNEQLVFPCGELVYLWKETDMTQEQRAERAVNECVGAVSTRKNNPCEVKGGHSKRQTNSRQIFPDASCGPQSEIDGLKDREIHDIDERGSELDKLDEVVLRTFTFREETYFELLVREWPHICRAGRFLGRTMFLKCYKDVISEDQIVRLEEGVAHELSLCLKELRSRVVEVEQLLDGYGVYSEAGHGKNLWTFCADISNPLAASALEFCQVADMLTALLRVLDSCCERRGLTRSESSAAIRKEMDAIHRRVSGAIRQVIEVQKQTRAYIERSVCTRRTGINVGAAMDADPVVGCGNVVQ